MSDNTSTSENLRSPWYLLWHACHVLAVILLYNLVSKWDRLPSSTYTILTISVTTAIAVISLARLVHVFRRRTATRHG